jgi:hypothetical protein
MMLSFVRLEKWLREIFRGLPLPSLPIERGPMLVVVIHIPAREDEGSSLVDYPPQAIQCGEMSIQTSTRLTLEKLLEALRSFKEKFVFHQKLLVPFDITKSIPLCPDVLVEIAEYLSLSDAINAFSMGILPLLRDGPFKVHLNNPSEWFVEMIPRHLDPRQVASLHISMDPLRPTSDLSAFRIFDQLSSLTVSSIGDLLIIYQCLYHLRHVRRLSLWFKDQFNYSWFRVLANLSNYRITHLRIHFADDSFDLDLVEGDPRALAKNSTVTSFILDLGDCPLHEISFDSALNVIFLIYSVFRFIDSLVNLRRLRLIITRNHLPRIFDKSRWQYLISECVHLNRVIIDVVGNEICTKKAKALEEEMRKLRPGIIFRIATLQLD